jgi:hypothetical protein
MTTRSLHPQLYRQIRGLARRLDIHHRTRRSPQQEREKKETAGTKIIVGIVIAVAVATCGYITSYLEQQRKDQIAFIDTQIEKLYGPLYALIQARNTSWAHFRAQYWSNRNAFFQQGTVLRPEEIVLWRRWMREVFQPMNAHMANVIIPNAQLLVGNMMPRIFLQLISHAESYKAVMAEWDERSKGQFVDTSPFANESPVAFPPVAQLTACLTRQYNDLRVLQSELATQPIVTFRRQVQIPPVICLE